MPIVATPLPQVLEACLAAHAAAALAQFEKDGSVDCGSCGGAMLGYRANTRFAKAILAGRHGYVSDGKVFLSVKLPEGVATQHAEVPIQAARAFMAVAESHGFTASKFWTYTD